MIRENIANLTSLWMTVAQYVQAYQTGPAFNFCAIPYSDWPNRLWFGPDINAEGLEEAKKQLRAMPIRLIVPWWSHYHPSDALLKTSGFICTSEQLGMSLPLSRTYPAATGLHLERVSTPEMAVLWEDLFQQAFGYRISHHLLLSDYKNTRFFAAFHQGQPCGTCLLHHAEERVLGIHALGIVPQMRGEGLARQLMHVILNEARAQEFTHATLQSSAMGKELYLKLGFAQEFLMRNYTLPA